jgi:hypothetical protein
MSEGPFTIIGALAGVVGAGLAYLALAYTAHLAPFHGSGNAAASSGVTAGAGISTPASSGVTTAPGISTTTFPAGNSSVPPGGPVLEYSSVGFRLPGGGCASGISGSTTPVEAEFTTRGPTVSGVDGSPGAGSVYLDCSSPASIFFDGTALTADGQPNAAACLSDLADAPRVPVGFDFTSLKTGQGFCYLPGGGSNQLVFLRLASVDQSTYDTSWSATAWNVP